MQNRKDSVKVNIISTNEKVRMKGSARLVSYCLATGFLVFGSGSVLYDTIIGYTQGYVRVWDGISNSVVMGIIAFMVGVIVAAGILWLVWDDIVEAVKNK